MTGMFYDTATHRIYYTVSGDSRLFYRYFTPESEIVGAQTFTADAGGINFSSAAGMTLASGRILYGSSDGSLRTARSRAAGSPAADRGQHRRHLAVPRDLRSEQLSRDQESGAGGLHPAAADRGLGRSGRRCPRPG